LIAHKETKCLSLPTHLWLKEGNVHDLVALREIADELPSEISLYADKAYADEKFKSELQSQQIKLFTPIKKPKKAELTSKQKLFNKVISVRYSATN
jgi:IS5 family transposase